MVARSETMGSELNVENVLGAEGADAGHGAQDMERPVADADGACRSKRADARRNYERLVGAARRVFASEGAGASMEAIAREAGVGVG
ncbi:MAG: hypothetical protein ACRDYD_09155, partial [Acidimicrobiales bacterium]